MKRVALFTDFSPATGGGAAILRNLVGRFNNVQVQWFYTASKNVDLPGTVRISSLPAKGNALGELVDFCRLWVGWRNGELMEMAKPILAASPDVHWVVAHGEGISLGNMLKELRPQIPLHVTVHDDPEHGLLKRSRRYRYLACLVRKPMRELMTKADSVDVISRPMQEYYHKQFGIKSEVVHICVDKLPNVKPHVKKKDELHIGHIGSLYSQGQFASFLRGIEAYAKKSKIKPVLIIIGGQPWLDQTFTANLAPSINLVLLGHLSEEEAVKKLSFCDFVYCAYPFNSTFKTFRQTSLPTKLSTYVQAERPIFAHTPTDSTLANVVTEFHMGIVCPEAGIEAIVSHIEMIKNLEVAPEKFEIFRDRIFGIHNVKRLENLLLQA